MQVDVDALRTAAGWKPAYQDFWKQNGPAVGPLLNVLGLDPKDDLHGVTILPLISAVPRTRKAIEAVAIISIDFDKKQLVAKLNSMVEGGTKSHGWHPIYRWEASFENGKQQNVCVALYSSTTLVAAYPPATSSRRLTCWTARAQISPSKIRRWPWPCRSVRYADRGLDVDKLANRVESPLLKQCQSLSLAIGEHDKQTFADGQVRLTSDETAQQIEALVNGFRAFYSVAAGQPRRHGKVARPIAMRSQRQAGIPFAPRADR